ncbi:MAG: Jag N-terminal domain-containing protein [Candidatus Omnitrophica bacterium]|nr:Jag N-terminal domain-containing protein [Candidatus Omnitrophota bacterium]
MPKESNKPAKSIEAYGTTVEEAIQKALKELKVERDRIIVKVVSEEKKGLFGMEGEKPAKIIVSLKES